MRWAATVGTGTVNPSCDTSSGESHVRGTQSVRRALQLLRRVAKSNDRGVRLAQLVRDEGLDRATTYRLMSCLVEEQFVDRDSEHLYRLGPEAVLLGSLLPQPTPLLRRFVPVMKRIGRIAGDTVFLMMRQGDFVYCAHREEGHSPIKILTTSIGQRRLLGTGTGGTAVLGLMDEAEVAGTFARNSTAYAEHRISLDRLQALGTAVREQGCALVFDSFGETGVAGLGIAFRMGKHGMGAISVATLTARFGFERQHRVRQLVETELRGLGLHA
ncbi:IclR family transcriptional regulator [Verminephrobacter eiseniae]|nr:IclR family transcriptional regulator [Verminephrobacter eiseniae]MCW5305339.1 IclR family transcriptional regulator [Verminephrobacter eiseniae]MCW8179170.1 IclR family transcriptional regulator [Verminephrobacter eiseniae]MCW8189768.1 IclR family transcriptional regulator [Verminephrobacter eiseniae]